ncbi:hypothetical protein, conserved [Babesia ovata]|uniref:Extracellular matrix-binding ebh n=1 Tax=Babesia ovata TaxID=189622 RepID=A0A2H6KK30_9APIC|nr:uncharacterized protein BOVATA_048330 [Babesia ovata]GBE63340.1 hypothetical protein, conserved [Babesia ovata]
MRDASLLVSLPDSLVDLLAVVKINVNQLIKLLETSCGDKGCDCYDKKFRDGLKNLQKQFNEVDEIETKINSLKKQKDEKGKASEGTPSGSDREIQKKIDAKNKELEEQKKLVEEQITQLKSALNDPKDKISEYINSLNDKIDAHKKEIEQHKKNEQLKNANKNISIPSHLSSQLETAQAKLKSHEASLGSLENLGKLCQHCKDVDAKKDKTPKDILENLTEGLEKFLGYENGNYTGEGIVYSDLDRLCDGVMSFLLHCLKGSEGLLTFYNPKIPSIISELSAVTGKGSGVKGFAEAIESVRQGLEGYESGMTSKSKKVVEDVTTIQSNFTSLREYLENTNNKNLQAQLQQVQEKSRLYWVKASLAEEARKALDPALSGKLDKHVSLGVHAADTFKKIAFNPENIDTAIEQGITDVQKTLNSGFDGIKQKLESLYQKKDEQFTSVNESIKDAKMLVSELLAKDAKKFNDQYRDYIIAKFESLKLSAAALKVDPNPGTQCQLEKEVNAVKQAVEEIEIAYQKKLRDVKMKVDLAVNQAVSLFKLWILQLKNGLKHVREQIKIQLQGFLQHVWTAVELGMQRAAVGDTYSPTKGVTGLETGFQTAKLNDLETRFREVAHDNPELAKKIQTVLSDLNLVKDDKSGTPTGDVLFEQLGGDIKAALENQLKDVIKDEISLIDLTTLMNAYYRRGDAEHGEHVRLRGLINLIKVPVSKDGFTGDGVTAGFKPVEMDGYTHKQVRSHDNEGVKSNYYRALQKVVNNINNLESLLALLKMLERQRREWSY